MGRPHDPSSLRTSLFSGWYCLVFPGGSTWPRHRINSMTEHRAYITTVRIVFLLITKSDPVLFRLVFFLLWTFLIPFIDYVFVSWFCHLGLQECLPHVVEIAQWLTPGFTGSVDYAIRDIMSTHLQMCVCVYFQVDNISPQTRIRVKRSVIKNRSFSSFNRSIRQTAWLSNASRVSNDWGRTSVLRQQQQAT